MKVRIAKSRGTRIAKSPLRRIVMPPMRSPREVWEDAFRAMAERGDDYLLDEWLPTSFDQTEWE